MNMFSYFRIKNNYLVNLQFVFHFFKLERRKIGVFSGFLQTARGQGVQKSRAAARGARLA